MSNTIQREAEGMPCPKCNGYADRAQTTKDERALVGCDLDQVYSGECCARAFICRLCGNRATYTADAPEYDE